MASNAYIAQTRLFLNDLNGQFYQTSDLLNYINSARSQVAAQSGSLLASVQKTLGSGLNSIPLTNIFGTIGFGSALNVRSISLVSGATGALTLLEGRPWQWFQNYYGSGSPSASSGPPAVWAQLRQGTTGSVSFSPKADAPYLLSIEASFFPAALEGDGDPEALAYPWTDAIPYFAAYLAYLNAQRTENAMQMMQVYQKFMGFARTGVTPDVMPLNFPLQTDSIVSPIQPTDGGGGGA